MGFYDRSDHTRKRASHLLTGLISGLVSGVLVLTLSLSLLFTQTTLFSPAPSVGSDSSTDEGAVPVQKVSVDVNSNITEGVKKFRPAVVSGTARKVMIPLVCKQKNREPDPGSSLKKKRKEPGGHRITTWLPVLMKLSLL